MSLIYVHFLLVSVVSRINEGSIRIGANGFQVAALSKIRSGVSLLESSRSVLVFLGEPAMLKVDFSKNAYKIGMSI